MKAVNAAWRKAGRPKPHNTEAWAKARADNPELSGALQTARLEMARDILFRAPYTWALTNNSANIKRMKGRIAELHQAGEREQAPPIEGAGWRVVEAVEDNRVQIHFTAIPAQEIRTALKSQGFRWARSNGCWQRHLNNAGRAAASYIVQHVLES